MRIKSALAIAFALYLGVGLHVAACSAAEMAAPPVPPLSARIGQLAFQEMAAQNIPGYALIVLKNGEVIVHRGFGAADLRSGQPVTPRTIFGLASVTKTFTALTLLTLVDQKRLSLEDPLQKYVPVLPPPYSQLTIRQLATMTSGIPRNINPEVKWQNQLPILARTPLDFQPGTDFEYSNFNYRLLGSVIERVTGQPYFQVVSQTILQPLGMSDTGTTVSLAPTGRVAQAYGDRNGTAPVRMIEYKDPEVSFAAGMLASTVDDLLKYVQALMSHRILSEQGYNTLWYQRPDLPGGKPAPWAFGWFNKITPAYNSARAISMNGGTPGVASLIIMLPEQNSAVIALCSLRKPGTYAIGRKVAALAFGDNTPDSAPPGEPLEQGTDD